MTFIGEKTKLSFQITATVLLVMLLRRQRLHATFRNVFRQLNTEQFLNKC